MLCAKCSPHYLDMIQALFLPPLPKGKREMEEGVRWRREQGARAPSRSSFSNTESGRKGSGSEWAGECGQPPPPLHTHTKLLPELTVLVGLVREIGSHCAFVKLKWHILCVERRFFKKPCLISLPALLVLCLRYLYLCSRI